MRIVTFSRPVMSETLYVVGEVLELVTAPQEGGQLLGDLSALAVETLRLAAVLVVAERCGEVLEVCGVLVGHRVGHQRVQHALRRVLRDSLDAVALRPLDVLEEAAL